MSEHLLHLNATFKGYQQMLPIYNFNFFQDTASNAVIICFQAMR